MINKNKIISWIPAVIWMLVIFYMSAQPAAESNSLSTGITEQIIETLGRFISIDVETTTSKRSRASETSVKLKPTYKLQG